MSPMYRDSIALKLSDVRFDMLAFLALKSDIDADIAFKLSLNVALIAVNVHDDMFNAKKLLDTLKLPKRLLLPVKL